MKKNVYYIEDSDVDFRTFSKSLEGRDLSIFPTLENWKSELDAIKLYLQNQSDDNRTCIVEIFKSYNVDLFLIDLSLFHTNSGGKTIYDDIISCMPEFKDKCVLFFTYRGAVPITPIAGKVGLEFKSRGREGGVDYKKTSQQVYDNIKELLKLEDTFMGFVVDIY